MVLNPAPTEEREPLPLERAHFSKSPPAANERDDVRGTFLASLNHEIRTPLSGIMGMADLLLETGLDDEQKEYVNTARLCAENLLEIFNATIEYSALSAGKVTLEESEFTLKDLLAATVSQQLAKAQAKGLNLSSRCSDGLPETMLGDPARLRQLLGHLLANAIKFTHSGSVELIIRPERDAKNFAWMAVEVRDTGIGIAPDKLETIFESFRQVESGLARSYSGLGLGLALAQKLAALMHGEIRVESAVGKGSAFTVRIPLPRPADAIPENPTEAAKAAGPAILVVEDNPVNLMVLRHGLSTRQIQVDSATNGLEAVKAASQRHYDLILMDLQMPEMDGLEATLAVRKLPGYASVPILALTADTSDELRERCRQHGMQAFLSKPFRMADLWTVVSGYLTHDA